MKTTLKKYMTAVVAVMLVIGFSAFKVVESTKAVSMSEKDLIRWRFTGGPSDDPIDPSNYIEKEVNDPSCDQITDLICEIEAPSNANNKPALEELVDQDDHDGPTYEQLIEQAMQSKTTNDVVKDFRSQ